MKFIFIYKLLICLVVEQNARDLKEKSDSSDEEEYISRKERMKLKEQQKLENEKKEMARIKPPSDDVWSKKEKDGNFIQLKL